MKKFKVVSVVTYRRSRTVEVTYWRSRIVEAETKEDALDAIYDDDSIYDTDGFLEYGNWEAEEV